MDKIKNIFRFLTTDIWRLPYEQNKKKSLLYVLLQVIELSFKLCTQRQLLVQASALTYYTFFATIPLLAFIFAIGKGFGLDQHIILFFSHTLDPSQSELIKQLFTMIKSYLAHAKEGVFIGIGLIFLLWSVYNVFTQIEKSFNEIWGIHKARTFLRRITDYFSLILLIPFIIIVSSGISIYINHHMTELKSSAILYESLKFILAIKPWALSSLLCTLIYLYMPNTKVKIINALCAGLLAGCAILITKEVYFYCMRWATGYNAVYGSLAAIPLFMLFFRLMWIELLCGVEITFAGQHIKMFEFAEESNNINLRYYQYIQLFMLYKIIKAFEEGYHYSKEDFIKKDQIPVRLINKALNNLLSCQLIVEIKGDAKDNDFMYQPAISIDKISIGYFFDCLEKSGQEEFLINTNSEDSIKLWKDFLSIKKEINTESKSSKILIKDL